MSIITSDIIIKGKHAEIIKNLVENNLFDNGAEIFINASLMGLYHGRKSEPDDSGSEKVEISRTIWNNRREIENSLFVFLQHEKVFQKQPLEVAEVFNMNLDSVDKKELFEELKQYALYGVEKLGEMYSELKNTVDKDLAIQITMGSYIYPKVDLIHKLEEEQEYFYKADEDEDVISILNS